MIKRLFYIFGFVFYYLFQLIRSNISLAFIILTPGMNIKSGFIEVPLYLKSNLGLLLFSNLVSMTPGSLVTNISEDKRIATVHILYSTKEDDIKTEVERMQNKIKRFTS